MVDVADRGSRVVTAQARAKMRARALERRHTAATKAKIAASLSSSIMVRRVAHAPSPARCTTPLGARLRPGARRF
ncbi:MAG: hypothetical protein ACREEN_00395 [Stellaceae bacterium]